MKARHKKFKILEREFQKINYEVFDGELEKACILVTSENYLIENCLGWFSKLEGINTIVLYSGMCYNTGILTLIHEMIHMWQEMNGLALNHGNSFIKKRREAAKFYNLNEEDI